MPERKNRISRIYILIGGLVILFAIWYIVDDTHFDETSIVTKRPVVMAAVAAFLILFSLYTWKVLLYASPTITYPGGHTSWMPMAELPKIYPRELAGKKSLPWPVYVIPKQTFAAMGVHSISKGGDNGFMLIPALDGVVERAGENLKLNVQKPEIFITQEDKRDIWLIMDDLADLAKQHKWNLKEESPIEYWVVPYKEGAVMNQNSINKLIDQWDAAKYYMNLSSVWKDQNKDLRRGQQMTRAALFPESSPAQPQRSRGQKFEFGIKDDDGS